jgi:glycosyltransferase involved in cell wall biosynthesis
MWDVLTAMRVDAFIANSNNVRYRIYKHYKRDALVVHPPVDIKSFKISSVTEDYYLFLGQLVDYKRVDLAIECFSHCINQKLVIIGEGKIPRRAKNANIIFLGRQDDQTVKHYLSRCKAIVFPGEEDFGIVPIEAMASGRPVIAYGKGGATETVLDGITGVLFHEQTPSSLANAIERFEATKHSFDSRRIRNHAENFDKGHFKEDFLKILSSLWQQFSSEKIVRI